MLSVPVPYAGGVDLLHRRQTKAYNCPYVRAPMTEFISISQAKKMRSGINIKATVKSVGAKRTVNLRSGQSIDVCDDIITDGDGPDDEMKLTLWGDETDKVKKDDVVVITNGFTKEFRGEISISKGKFGEMKINPEN